MCMTVWLAGDWQEPGISESEGGGSCSSQPGTPLSSLAWKTQSQYERLRPYSRRCHDLWVTGPEGQFLRVRVKGDSTEESSHMPRHLRPMYSYVFLSGGRQGVLDKRPSSAAFWSHTIDEAPLSCQGQLLHAGTSESTRLTFKTSDVRSLFIIHSIRRPADAQHPHVQREVLIFRALYFFFFLIPADCIFSLMLHFRKDIQGII